MAAIKEEGGPYTEFNEKLIREGKEAEARGESIGRAIVRVLYDG